MKTSKYSLIRQILDNYSNIILSDLPREFTVNAFAERFHRCFPVEFGNAIIRSGSESFLKKWISIYYLPRKSFIKKYICGFGVYRFRTTKDRFEQLWQKS